MLIIPPSPFRRGKRFPSTLVFLKAYRREVTAIPALTGIGKGLVCWKSASVHSKGIQGSFRISNHSTTGANHLLSYTSKLISSVHFPREFNKDFRAEQLKLTSIAELHSLSYLSQTICLLYSCIRFGDSTRGSHLLTA